MKIKRESKSSKLCINDIKPGEVFACINDVQDFFYIRVCDIIPSDYDNDSPEIIKAISLLDGSTLQVTHNRPEFELVDAEMLVKGK